MISIGLFAMTSTITKPEKKWTVDSEWYEAKNYPCRVSFSIFWHLPLLIKKTGLSNFGRGDLSSKTKHFLFSTFMYIEKHTDYMQINYFPLVKEKNKKLTKEKGNLNITFVYSCLFQWWLVNWCLLSGPFHMFLLLVRVLYLLILSCPVWHFVYNWTCIKLSTTGNSEVTAYYRLTA